MIDSATTGTWLGQQVTFVTVNAGAFETWMVSWGGSGPDVFVQLGGQSAKVIGADQPADAQNFPNGGFKRLILQGTGYTGAAAGEWYTIKGNCTTEDIARCGSWSAPASHSGGATTFVLNPLAEVRDEQIGWWLQPDINCQAWFPIIAVSESAHTVTVAGNHAALGAQGTRFRIHAPPGVQTRGSIAGLLPMFAEAASSRCLYKGYRYETAAAGRWTSQGIAARQGGKNFTGQHYTLFRHFDPSLMRFTSLDPIAASQNLWAYCDNNPHGSYDPDGLENTPGGGWFIDFNWEAYKKRFEATFEGAAFFIADSATLGLYFKDDDRLAMVEKHHRQGTDLNFIAGGVTGSLTYNVVAMLATGGASTVVAGPRAGLTALQLAQFVRMSATAGIVAQTGYAGYQAGTAIGDVMNGKEWTTETSLRAGLFAMSIGLPYAGRALSRLPRWVNPFKLRFSQRSAGGGTPPRAPQLRQKMAGGWNAKEGSVDVIATREGWVTFDNTRVAIAQELGMPRITARVHYLEESLPAGFAIERDLIVKAQELRLPLPKTWGDALRIRTMANRLPLEGTTVRPILRK